MSDRVRLSREPSVGHGRVLVATGVGVPVRELVRRVRAGDEIEAVAEDFGVPPRAVSLLLQLADELAPEHLQVGVEGGAVSEIAVEAMLRVRQYRAEALRDRSGESICTLTSEELDELRVEIRDELKAAAPYLAEFFAEHPLESEGGG